MDSVMNKLASLPLSAKQKLSSPEFLSVFDELDKKYNTKAAIAFLEYVFGYVKKEDLPLYLGNKFNLKPFAVNETVEKFNFLLSKLPEMGIYDTSDEEVVRAQTAKKDEISSTRMAEKKEDQDIAKSSSFDVEDELEIAKYKQNSASLPKDDYNYKQLSDIIIQETGTSEENEILLNRLKNIVLLNLKGIRDEMETKDALTKSQKIGGMGYENAKAETVLKSLKNNNNVKPFISDRPKILFPQAVSKSFKSEKVEEIRQPAKVKTLAEKIKEESGKGLIPIYDEPVIDLTKNQLTNSSGPALKKENGTLPPRMSIEEEDGLPIFKMPDDLMVAPKVVDLKTAKKETVTASAPQNEINELLNESVKNISIEPVETAENFEPLPAPTPYSSVKNIPQRIIDAQNTRRPLVDGIRISKKLTGPIEELGEMTLIEFRRLAANPQAATDEVREKIALLQEESYSRKMEGVSAWFKNEINKFYRLLGSTAMDQNRNIEEVIKERLLAGKPTLTSEEFEAIMKLNKDLRY